MTENWKGIPSWIGVYEASDLGAIRSLPRKTRSGPNTGRVLKRQTNNQGYPSVCLSGISYGKGIVRRLVSSLVLEAFVGPCPSGMVACHTEVNDPWDCRLTNLRWDTQANNIADKLIHGTQTRGEDHPVSFLTEAQAVRIINIGDTMSDGAIAAQFGISRQHVGAIQDGRVWRHLHRGAL